MIADSYNSTELKDRILWVDGDSTVSVDRLMELCSLGKPTSSLCVPEVTPEVAQFNQYTSANNQISVKTNIRQPTPNWNIPDEYKNLDIEAHMRKLLEVEVSSMSSDDIVIRERRVLTELALYKKLNYENMIRALIYVINTLNAKNVVWGVGRGSSVSSYVLYLIGVHDIDSVEYELDVSEFLR